MGAKLPYSFAFTPRAMDRITEHGRKNEEFVFSPGFSPVIGEAVLITTPDGPLRLIVIDRMYSVNKAGVTVLSIHLDLPSDDAVPEHPIHQRE